MPDLLKNIALHTAPHPHFLLFDTTNDSILFDGQWEWIEENQSINFIYQSDGNTMEMQAEITDKIVTRDEGRLIKSVI